MCVIMCVCNYVCVCVPLGESAHVHVDGCARVCYVHVRVSKNVMHVELVNTIHFKN